MKKYALTSPQKELLALELYHDQSKLNTLKMTVMFKENVNEEDFTKIMNQMIQDNEVLRTKLVREDHQIYQVIKDHQDEQFEFYDLSSTKNDYEEWYKHQSEKVIDVWNEKLYEITMFRDHKNAFGAQFILHHLICDAWSIIEMTKQFVQYLHNNKGKMIQYDTFIDREESYKMSEKYTQDESYWKDYIDSFGKDLEVIFKKEVESEKLHANRMSISLDEKQLSKIERINQGTRKNTFDYLLNVTAIWIHNQWGIENFNIGLPILNRINKRERQMLGLCISTVPMNFKVSDDVSFSELHQLTHDRWKKLLRHQKYPLTQIKNIFKEYHGDHRLFDVLCSYQTSKITEETKYMDLKWHPSLSQTTPLMIHFDDKENKNKLNIDFDFLESFISREDLENAMDNWMTILEESFKNQDNHVSSYKGIKKIDYDKSIIHSLYERSILHPNKTAVQSEGIELDYSQLIFLSSLLKKDIKSHLKPIGIMMNRGVGMIVAMISALMQQRPMVLIDPNLPKKRIAFIFDDLDLEDIIIDKHYEIADAYSHINKVMYSHNELENHKNKVEHYNDREIKDKLNLEKENFLVESKTWDYKNDLFIIYTSGTTGIPKGVAVTEGLIRNLAEYQKKYTSIHLNDVNIGQFSVVNFDPIYQEVFTTLLTSNTLIVIPEEIKLDPIRFLKYIDKNNINFIYLPTGYFKALMNNDIKRYIPKSLNDIVVAGEQLKLNINAKTIIRENKISIHNHYGPAEAHVVTTETINDYGNIPSIPTIGRAIKNHKMRILDDTLKEVERHQTGELFIESPLLSKGYINRPDETQKKFLKSPFNSEMMMYRTGDLAYVNEENKIVFLGRADDQIKIRGKRVELGEIENTLAKLTYCKEATVINQVINETNTLSAYCIVDRVLEYCDFVKDLEDFLPDYMMPDTIYTIDKMPLTFNGKVDKKKLEKITYNQKLTKVNTAIEKNNPSNDVVINEKGDAKPYVNKVVPLSEMGEKIAVKLVEKIKQLLSIRHVELSDHFFSLGGDSLKLIELNFFIQENFGVGIGLSYLYENDGIGDIVGFIEKKVNEQKNDEKEYSVFESYIKDDFEKDKHEGSVIKASNVQRDIYFATQISENKTAYNMPALYKINRRVDAQKIDKVLKKVMERYDNLRANFFINQHEVVQVIRPFNHHVEWEVSDIESNSQPIEEVFNHFIRPFDLEKDDLFRCKIVYDNDLTYLFLDWHHVIMDGISQSIFVKHFIEALIADKSQVIENIADESDYLVSNQQVLHLENQANQSKEVKAFFEKYLVDYNQKSLVSIMKGENTHNHEKGHQSYQSTMDLSMMNKVNDFLKEHHISTFTLMSSIFMRTLEKCISTEDLIISVPFSGRTQLKYRETLGMYVNTMPLRLNCNKIYENDHEFLKERQQEIFKIIENQHVASDQWKQYLKDNDPFQNQLDSPMDILFAYQNVEPVNVIDEVSVEPMIFDFVSGKNPLTWMMFEYEGKVTIHVEYDRGIFSQRVIEKIENDMNRLLQKLLFEEENIFISQKEEFIDMYTPLKPVKNIYEIMKTNFRVYKDEIALKNNDEIMTYKELELKVETQAQYLQEMGIASGHRVGIHCNRSMALIIHLLSIIKIGGSYVPIDEALPEKRKQVMLKDADAYAYINQEGHVEICNKDAKKSCYDSEIYVMYTSGSTGHPKGISVSHSNVADLVLKDSFTQFNHKDVILMSVSLSFDVSTFEIWGALLNGSCLCTATKDVILDTKLLESYLEVNKVNKLFMSTALFNKHIRHSASCFNVTERLYIGGEALDYHAINIILDEPNRPKVYNAYGPTENTSFSTMYEIPNSSGDLVTSISIGKALIRRGALIMDQKQNILRPYQLGELAVFGEGISNGYINNKALTDEKFIEHPKQQGKKLYLTGDLCWQDKDHNIHFVGRKDSQVKLRGIRIECDEIKNKAMDLCEIDEAIVMLDINKQRLVMAYTGIENPQKVLEKLTMELPKYMIPSVIKDLDEMPVNKNGKIDKDIILAMLLEDHNEISSMDLNQLTADEMIIKEIWEEVLDVSLMSQQDDFFKLGGHSLKVAELINKIYKKMHIEIKINDIFEKSQFVEIVNLMNQEKNKRQKEMGKIKSFVDKYEEREKLSTYRLSDAQARVFAIDQISQIDTSYNIPIALEIQGVVDLPRLENAFKLLIENHEILRTSYQMIDDEPYAQISPKAISQTFKLDVFFEEQSHSLESIFSHFIQPFDLANDLPIRAGFVKGISNRQYMIIDVHHIAVDGSSAQLLYQHLFSYYKGETVNLPDISYRDYALYRNHQIATMDNVHQNYWKNKLKVYSKNIDLPFINDREEVFVKEKLNRESAVVDLKIESPLKHKIDQFCKDRNMTGYMFYMGAFQLLLNKYTGEKSFVIGSVNSGRNSPEIVDMIGMFVQTMPVLSVDFTQQYSVDDYFENVKRSIIDDMNHVAYPFERIVKDLSIQRQMYRNPIFDMMFIMQNYDSLNHLQEHLNVHQIPLYNKNEKMDLTFEVINHDQSALLQMSYVKGLYKEDYMRNLLTHYVNIMNQLVTNNEDSIQKIGLLSSEEGDIIYKAFNQPTQKYNTQNFVQRLDKVLNNLNSKIALRDGKRALSYRMLDDSSKQLMRYLLAVSNEEVVAVLSDKSVMTYVGVIGIVRSGKAYMPIDMSFPKSRIEYILENSQVRTIIGTKKNMDKFKVDMKGIIDKHQLIMLEEDNITLENCPDAQIIDEKRISTVYESILKNASIDDTLNVLYTSGTTGKPKGVVVTSRGVARMIEDENFVKWGELKNHMAVAPLVFDLSSYDIWATLLNEGTLNLVDKSTLLNPQRLSEFVAQNDIESAMFPTAIFNSIALNYKEAIHSLSIIYVIGDVLSVKGVATFIDGNEKVKIINAYGPTENSVVSTYYEVNNSQVKSNGYKSFPIGINLNGSEAFVLDDSMNRVPHGVVGQLYVSGDGLAKGYLNQPSLTEEKFIKAPWDHDKMLYETGDLASLTVSQELNFHGRSDDQVKIRGNRIELGEIEKHLLSMDYVKESATILIKEEETLFAFVVVSEEETMHLDPSVISENIKLYLKSKLPEYGIPNHIEILKALPMTVNGKVDKSGLKKKCVDIKVSTMKASKTEFVLPRHEMDKKLVEIWEKVIGYSPISIKDNYFDIGGDSIRAITLFSLLSKEGIDFDIEGLLKYSSIEKISDYILSTESEENRIYNKIANNKRKGMIPLRDEGENLHAYVFPSYASKMGYYIQYKSMVDRIRNCDFTLLTFVEEQDIIGFYTDMIAEDYKKRLSERGNHHPYPLILLGYSLGGCLGAEVAHELRKRDIHVDDLIIIDSPFFDGNSKEEFLYPETRAAYMKFSIREEDIYDTIDEATQQIIIDDFVKETVSLETFVNTYRDLHPTCRMLMTKGTQLDFLDYNQGLMDELGVRVENEEVEGKEDLRKVWEQISVNEYVEYDCYGLHPEILQPQYIDVNSKVIQQALNDVYRKHFNDQNETNISK